MRVGVKVGLRGGGWEDFGEGGRGGVEVGNGGGGAGECGCG